MHCSAMPRRAGGAKHAAAPTAMAAVPAKVQRAVSVVSKEQQLKDAKAAFRQELGLKASPLGSRASSSRPAQGAGGSRTASAGDHLATSPKAAAFTQGAVFTACPMPDDCKLPCRWGAMVLGGRVRPLPGAAAAGLSPEPASKPTGRYHVSAAEGHGSAWSQGGSRPLAASGPSRSTNADDGSSSSTSQSRGKAQQQCQRSPSPPPINSEAVFPTVAAAAMGHEAKQPVAAQAPQPQGTPAGEQRMQTSWVKVAGADQASSVLIPSLYSSDALAIQQALGPTALAAGTEAHTLLAKPSILAIGC